ncbi:MAG: hypothetical protein WCC29_04990 [Pseudomonas farsensis]|uniref:hypothetical protein n=1 Tax=Pseudomonas farsensis TaxID=2745492 RepID=UPI003C7A985F
MATPKSRQPDSLSEPSPQTEEQESQSKFSGEADYIYTSKISTKLHLDEACEALVSSSIFPLALSSNGKAHYKINSILHSKFLDFTQSLTGLGMTVTGHQDYYSNNPGLYNTYLLQRAFDLHLSSNKLFIDGYGFPAESARIFMRPLALKLEESEEHEIFCPSFRVYDDGTISVCLTPINGFSDLGFDKLINCVVNRNQRNISSIICERDIYLASIETQYAKFKIRERLGLRGLIRKASESSLSKVVHTKLFDEEFRMHELLTNGTFTLTDLAQRLLELAERSIALGGVRQKIHLFAPQYCSSILHQHWFGKPLIYISNHSNQQYSSKENWAHNEHSIQCIMARSYLLEKYNLNDIKLTDLRLFDDYNSFYSEAVTLVVTTTQVTEFLSNSGTFKFSNITCDIQTLNELSHHLIAHYAYTSLTIEKCKTSIEIAKLELNKLAFEESFISAKKHSETSKHFDYILSSDHLSSLRYLADKKIESSKKHQELKEKVTSDSQGRRLTIVFGLIASAVLSPELMQPLLQTLNLGTSTIEGNKLLGMALSILTVTASVIVINYAPKIFNRLFK